MDIDDFIVRYEINKIINNNRNTIYLGNDIEEATRIYEDTVKKYLNSEDHVIIYLFDANIGTDINRYDNELDVC